MDYRTQNGATLDYNYGSQAHAVTAVPGGQSFGYDASGQRVKTVQPDGRILYTPFPTYEEEVWPVAATTPIVTLTANWQTAVTIPPNTAFTLQWQASNAFACEAGGSWSGSKPTSGSEIVPGFESHSRTYSLTCYNSAGPTTQSVTVTIGRLPSLTFTANGVALLRLPPLTNFTLAWSSSWATTCVASGSWSGRQPTSGSQSIGGFSSGSRTYTLACSNSYGTTTRSVVVEILIFDPCGSDLCNGSLSLMVPSLDGPTSGQTVIQRSTYSLAGQAIAVRVAGSPLATNNGLFYLYSDHLGSASAIVTSGGQKVNETRYLPFGGYRSGGPNAITDRGFTGQKENMELGLLYYNARFYAPGLGRFLSADTIVPDPTNPQSYNRYTYVLNQPIVGTDPDGHCFPLCTAAIGGLLGGIAGGITYYVTTPAAERNFSDASLAVGIGAVGGALIGTGVGLAAASTVTTVAAAASTATASTMLISAGTGTVVAAETNMIMNGITGGSFDRTDFALGATIAMLEGAAAPGLGPVRSIASSSFAGAGESLLSDALHGQEPSLGDALSSGLWAGGSGALGSSVEGLAKGLSGSNSISRGVQSVDFTSMTSDSFILRSWQIATAKQSTLSSIRTLIRNTFWEVPAAQLEELD